VASVQAWLLGQHLAALAPDHWVAPSRAEDAALIQEFLRTGDDDLFGALVRRYQDRVFRLALSVLGPGMEAEAEDLVQDIFIQVFRKLETFRGESSFSAWLYRLSYNRCLDRRRQARLRHPHVSEMALEGLSDVRPHADPATMTAQRERRHQLLALVDGLPDLQRSVILLHYWMGLSVCDIASMLDVKPGTIKSHLFRARQTLANHWTEGVGHE
jgi:RNA polymerase sigma-70 factor (ECF subfamily)